MKALPNVSIGFIGTAGLGTGFSQTPPQVLYFKAVGSG